MDNAAIETAKLLGSGSAQIILGLMVVALVGAVVWLARKLITQMEACHQQTVAMLTRFFESNDKLSDAIEVNTRVNEAAIAALRKQQT